MQKRQGGDADPAERSFWSVLQAVRERQYKAACDDVVRRLEERAQTDNAWIESAAKVRCDVVTARASAGAAAGVDMQLKAFREKLKPWIERKGRFPERSRGVLSQDTELANEHVTDDASEDARAQQLRKLELHSAHLPNWERFALKMWLQTWRVRFYRDQLTELCEFRSKHHGAWPQGRNARLGNRSAEGDRATDERMGEHRLFLFVESHVSQIDPWRSDVLREEFPSLHEAFLAQECADRSRRRSISLRSKKKTAR